ncbi:MAG: DNA-binding domain-containing protein [Sulfuritalea sp.]|nr:DNA-binding domain-containing protein [Sulfuritalea sp.]
MNTLLALQQRFQKAVISGDQQYANAMPGDVRGRLEIYANAYRGRLIDVLADNYPVLYRAMGDAAFRELANTYISAQPSTFRSVRWYGDGLVDFITEEDDRIPHPALADIARMDWATRAAFDAADANPLTHAELAGIAPEKWSDLRFSLVPSFDLIDIDWAIEALWHALNNDENAETEAPEAHRHSLIIWRYGLETRWRALQPLEALALKAVQSGASFAQCCVTLMENGSTDPAAEAAQFLQLWITEGVLASVLSG